MSTFKKIYLWYYLLSLMLPHVNCFINRINDIIANNKIYSYEEYIQLSTANRTIYPANIWLFTDLSKSYPALIWRVLRDNLLWHRTSFQKLKYESTHIKLSDLVLLLYWFDLIYCAWRHFQQYFSYVMATSFSGGRSRSNRREPPTMGK
jgi:hypothetical protein